MLALDETIYRNVVQGAVDTIPEIVRITDEVHAAGYDNLLLVGSGGSYGVMLAYESMAHERSTMPVRAAIAAELVLLGDPTIGERTVAVFSSLSGTTAETVAAAQWCQERGVTTIGLTGFADTPLAEASTHLLVNEADNSTAAESCNIQILLVVTRLLALRGEFDGWDELAAEAKVLPDALIEVNRIMEPIAADFAERHKDTDYHFLVGAGNLWGQVYNYSMCVLEEMQWLHTTRVHAAEFFHGSLELIERDTSLLLLFGEDRSRPLMDRVLRFAEKYNDDVTVLDTRTFPLEGISERFRDVLAPTAMGAACTRLSVHLEKVRNHSLDLRRYYRTVEY